VTHASPMPAAGAVDRPPLPFSHLLNLSVYWFGIQAVWGGVNGVVLPVRLEAIDVANSGTLLFITTLLGVAVAILVQPTIGMISDYTITRWGRRKPYIVIGAILDVVFLVGLGMSHTLLAIIAFIVLLQFSSNFAQGPFQGYVPDLVPAAQVATASGLMGVMIVLGQIAGVGVGRLGLPDALLPAAVGLGLLELGTALVLVFRVREGSEAPPRPGTWWQVGTSAWGTDVLRERNVLWVLLVRLLFLGALNITTLGLFYFARAHGLPQEEAGNMLFLATVIIGVVTAISAYPGARLSDRFGRKRMIWTACALSGTGLLGVAFAPTPTVAILSFVPFGMGAGAFLSVDWALMTDVIPKETTGRYMGILNFGTVAAGPVYLGVAGLVMDRVGAVDFAAGPRAAMLVAAGFVVICAIALLRVNPSRRELGAPPPSQGSEPASIQTSA